MPRVIRAMTRPPGPPCPRTGLMLLTRYAPRGFGFSDTAFRSFILMASRRLKSGRFFTTDYTTVVYAQAGLDWIDDNDMKSALLRHYPVLTPAIQDVANVFAPGIGPPVGPEQPPSPRSLPPRPGPRMEVLRWHSLAKNSTSTG